jgi:hypothetical protein
MRLLFERSTFAINADSMIGKGGVHFRDGVLRHMTRDAVVCSDSANGNIGPLIVFFARRNRWLIPGTTRGSAMAVQAIPVIGGWSAYQWLVRIMACNTGNTGVALSPTAAPLQAICREAQR